MSRPTTRDREGSGLARSTRALARTINSAEISRKRTKLYCMGRSGSTRCRIPGSRCSRGSQTRPCSELMRQATTTGSSGTSPASRRPTLMLAELARRGIAHGTASAVAPFGGPIYDKITWGGGAARYVYVATADAKNPGVPPNLDLPDGTVWRLDVLASHAALPSGVTYSSTPPGSFQYAPDRVPAPALQVGTKYHLTALFDVGVPRCELSLHVRRSPSRRVVTRAPRPGKNGVHWSAVMRTGSGAPRAKTRRTAPTAGAARLTAPCNRVKPPATAR